MDNGIYTFLGKNLYRLTPKPNEVSSVVNPTNIDSGVSTGFQELGYGGIRQGKTAFDNTETGFILGIDGAYAKFYIGNTTDYLNWTGTALTIKGTFVLGGTLVTVDNIANLASAITSVSTAGGGTVALTPATYNATTSFTIPSGVTLDMSGATINFGGGAYQILIEGTDAYSTGTLAVNYASSTVTGTGTTWTAAMVGRSILIGDYWYEITGRNSNTEITISPAFMAPNVTGETYVIATTVNDVAVINGTLTNSSTSALKFRYVNGLSMDGLGTTASTQGIDGDDSGNVSWQNTFIDDCVVGLTYDNVPFCTFSNWGITNITGGTAMHLTKVTNTSVGIASIQSVNGVGLKFTNCYNLGLINYSIIECSSHGIEFVSGNRDIDIESGYTDTVGGDAVKITATSDNINIDAQSFYNYTGYAINIAAASCDKTKVGLIAYGGGGSGTINDSGTGTVIMGDDTAYNATTWNGNMGTPTKNAVRDKFESFVPSTITVANEATDTTCFPLFVTAATGDLGPKTNANLAFNSNTGVFTFGADPIIPDEAYGAGWNGVLEPPTKNAVYDKIESLGGASYDKVPNTDAASVSYITYQIMPQTDTANDVTNGWAVSGATIATDQGGAGYLYYAPVADSSITASLPGVGSNTVLRFADIGANAISIKFRMKLGTVDTGERVGFGIADGSTNLYASQTSTTDTIRFVLAESTGDKLFAVNGNGVSNTSTNITGSLTLTNWNTYEIVITSTSILFYTNGTLAATHTTNLPTTTSAMVFGWGAEYNGGLPAGAAYIAPTIITLPTS